MHKSVIYEYVFSMRDMSILRYIIQILRKNSVVIPNVSKVLKTGSMTELKSKSVQCNQLDTIWVKSVILFGYKMF